MPSHKVSTITYVSKHHVKIIGQNEIKELKYSKMNPAGLLTKVSIKILKSHNRTLNTVIRNQLNELLVEDHELRWGYGVFFPCL